MKQFAAALACVVAAVVTLAARAPQSSVGLALFDEVWSTVNESYYDPTFGGLSWVGVRDELRPKAAAARSEDDARAVVNEMLGRLKRSHFALLASSGGYDDEMVLKGEANFGVEARVAAGGVVVTHVVSRGVSTAKAFAPGQRIVSIDGRSMAPRTGESPLISWRRVNAAMHGPAGSTAGVVVRTLDGAEQSFKVSRFVPSGELVQFSNLPPIRVNVDQRSATTPGGRRVGVIGFNIWMAQIAAPVEKAIDTFRSADGLIFDLRGNPGGLALMISSIAGHFVDTPDTLGVMRTRQVPQLKFVVNPRRSTMDGRSVSPFAGPVAIIVDELSASATECFAGGLQDLGRARIFGRTSMGQALPASTKRLANGDVLEYAIGDFVTSKGRSLEGAGVVPDEAQPLSLASLAAGKDDALAAALAWIDRGRAPRTKHQSRVYRSR